MKTLFALLVLVSITTSCSPDTIITNTNTINHNTYNGVKDSIGLQLHFPTLTDTIG